MNGSRLFRLFPPPVYITMPHSGVSLSDDGVRVIGFAGKEGHPHISHFTFEPLPVGVIVGGVITKPEVLIEVLKKIKSRYGIEFVAGSIPDEKAYIFKTTVPRQEGVNISDVVAFKIQETVPISLPDAVFDFTITEHTAETIDVVVRVVHQKVVDAYLGVFQAAGMKPILFKVESQAVADAVIGLEQAGACIVLHIEPSKTLCTIVQNGAVEFSTIIEAGTSSFVNALEKGFNISSGEARLLMTGEGERKENHDDIFFSVANVMSVLRDEVMKLEEYWNTKGKKGSVIDTVYISGVPASIDGFTHYLEQGTGLQVHPVNVWQNVFSINHQVPQIPFAEALDYAPAIGLGLPKTLHF